MQMLLYITGFIFGVSTTQVIAFLLRKKTIDYQQRIFNLLYNWWFHLCRLRIHITKDFDYTVNPPPLKLLFICNHINYLDTIYLNHFFTIHYPEHTIHYVFGASAGNSKLIGPYLNSHHFPTSQIQGKSESEQRKWISERMSKLGPKIIIVLFPEGRLLSTTATTTSASGSSTYKNVLPPRVRGFQLFSEVVDAVHDITLFYFPISDNYRFTEVKDFFLLRLAPHCFLHEKRIAAKGTSIDISQIWTDKDHFIDTLNNQSQRT